MRADDRKAIAVMVALVLATFTIRPLTSDMSFLGVSWAAIVLVGFAGLACRRGRLPALAVVAVQLAVLLVFCASLAGAMVGAGQPWYADLVSLWRSGVEHMQQQSTPMDPNDGVKLIFVAFFGLATAVTDLLVSGLDRPAWGIVPPATIFAVPAVGLGLDTGVMSFGCIAVGYLGILLADGLQTASRWTRGLSSDSAEGGRGPAPVVWGSASYIGIPALVATVVLGAALPTLSLPGFGFGEGRGGNGPLQLSDPTLDLRRNLNQAVDRTVLTYRTDAPGGVYLRMASLPRLSSSGWSNTEMDLTRGTELTAVPGLAAEPSRVRTTEVSVQDFSAEYLPLPYAPRSFSATGEWAFDPTSMVVVANGGANRRSAIRNLTYTVRSVDIQPVARDLARAVTGVPADSSVTAVFPAELPEELVRLSRQVTQDANTPAEEAAAIQEFLRGSRFTYTTKPRPGSGYQALRNFLLEDHEGYCEQFAGAMAMMARVVGIPSRVAVGFLPGERKGDVWEVSIHDMHAWPELYFSGYGWVRFEPTPSSVTGAPPDWTVGESLQAGDEPTTAPTATASEANPSAPPSASAAPSSRPVDAAADTGVPTARSLLTAGAGLLALMLLAAPATVRVRRRSARLSTDVPPQEQVEGAWAEIRDTVVDYGGRWPDGSPRTIGAEIGQRLPPGGSDTMSAVATLVERSRYARSLPYSDTLQRLPVLTSEIRRGLAEPRGFWSRLRAVVLPRSLFHRRRPFGPRGDG